MVHIKKHVKNRSKNCGVKIPKHKHERNMCKLVLKSSARACDVTVNILMFVNIEVNIPIELKIQIYPEILQVTLIWRGFLFSSCDTPFNRMWALHLLNKFMGALYLFSFKAWLGYQSRLLPSYILQYALQQTWNDDN